jgi:predicted ATPase
MGPGSTVSGRYLIESLAGEGGMGRVYRAIDLTSKAPVAMKLLGDRGRAERFSVEAEALASLDHDAIVRYVDQGTTPDGEPFLVMEWLEGESLEMRLARVGLTLEETLELADRITGALELIHARGIVHRDLKPSNVMLPGAEVSTAKIVDFGIARVGEGRALTATGLRLGTLYYMAPEQFFHPRYVDGRVDVFALGCIVFECLTGRRAFAAEDEIGAFARVVLEEAPPARSIRPELPEQVSAFVVRLLTRDQKQRPRADASLKTAISVLRRDLAGVGLGPPRRLPLGAGSTQRVEGATATSASVAAPLAPFAPRSALPPLALPRPFARLVGRNDELAHLEGVLRTGGGLITLWGPAGIGKTRLALEAARRWADATEAHGATLAGLRDAADEEGVLRAIAHALRPSAPLEGTSHDIEQAIARVLRAWGPFTLVLDGAERIAQPLEALVARWSSAAMEARFLVTSRERPRVGVAVEIGPLPAEGESSVAATLFCERAGPKAAGFAADPAACAAVAKIVRALDGNPLAIELAAARLEVLGLTALLERLAQPLSILGRTGTSGHALTMVEALAWSWSLLSDDERLAMARCSVFRGGFTIAAAEAVLGPGSRLPVVDLLQSLRDKSLLTSSLGRTTADPRLSMYAAVRDFARNKLDELGLAPDTLARHAEHYLAACTPLAERVATRGDVAALRALALDAEELLRVLEYARSRTPDLELTALLVLDPVLTTRGPYGRHPAMLDEAIARAVREPGTLPELLARARQARGRLASRLGKYNDARVDLEHALEEARRREDSAAEASALLDLGVLHHAMRNFELAREHYEAVAVVERDNPYVEARALGNLGALHHDQRRFDDAYACYVETIALFESLGDARAIGLFLANLAMLDHDRGRLADAARRYARALRYLEEAEDPRLLAIALGSLGMLEVENGQLELALTHHERARDLLAQVNDLRSEALCLGRLGATLASLGRLEPAGAALARGERIAKRDAMAQGTVRLLRGFLDAANAKVSLAEGHADEARAAIETARARVREATEPRGGPSALVDHSDDARAALRVLRPILERLGAAVLAQASDSGVDTDKEHQKSSRP